MTEMICSTEPMEVCQKVSSPVECEIGLYHHFHNLGKKEVCALEKVAKEVIGDTTIFCKTVQTKYQIIILRCAEKAGFTVFWAKLGIKSGAC